MSTSPASRIQPSSPRLRCSAEALRAGGRAGPGVRM